jgi:hypothetical protein
MGDLEVAIETIEAGLKCCITSTDSSLVPGSPICSLLEQYVATSSKLEPVRLSQFLACFSRHVAILETTLKMYQRISPSAYQHQLAVVDAILTVCDPRDHPIKHGKALVEKAKLIRFVPNSKLVSN